MTSPLFGVNLGRLTTATDAAPDGDPTDGAPTDGVPPDAVPAGPVAAARWAEQAGLDVVTAADHLGHAAPFVALAAAAAVTTRVRLRTYVLDFGFWNPALLARDVATLDVVSGGRVDLGLGAGHMPHEHAAAGLPFPPYQQRVRDLDAFATTVRVALDAADHEPAPVQRPVPLFLAAMSAAGLDVAARHGDVVGLSGLLNVPGAGEGVFRLATNAETDQRVAAVHATRAAAGLAPATFDVLVQHVVLDRDPAEGAAQMSTSLDGRYSPEELLGTPFMLFAATVQEAAAELERRTARWGVSSWCAHHDVRPRARASRPRRPGARSRVGGGRVDQLSKECSDAGNEPERTSPA
jgi:probable F420-dependent oxidoreductase